MSDVGVTFAGWPRFFWRGVPGLGLAGGLLPAAFQAMIRLCTPTGVQAPPQGYRDELIG